MSKRARKHMYVKRFLEKDEILKKMKVSGDDEANIENGGENSHAQIESILRLDDIESETTMAPIESSNSTKRNSSTSTFEGSSLRPDDSGSSSIWAGSSDDEDLGLESIGNVSMVNAENMVLSSNASSSVVLSSNASSSMIPLDDALKSWALTLNVNHKQLSELLKILKPHHDELPLDSRTLLGTVRSLNIQAMRSQNGNPGQYVYFGIRETLQYNLLYGNLHYILQERNMTCLEIKCNVDGLQIFKSRNIDFWPILAAVHIKGLKTIPFVVAIYMGDSKPNSLESFLADFINEIQTLSNTGLNFKNITYTFLLKYIICDAPARAFLKKIKCHNGYYACERCNVKGERINGRFIYRMNDHEEKRTHQTFVDQVHEGHHVGQTPLREIQNLDLVFGFPLDYMHMACLGVMRRLLNLWFKSDSKFRVSTTFRRAGSTRMLEIASWVPKEFGRQPRSFLELDRWKATEFRFFILYAGVFVMKDLLQKDKYKHFLHFVCAMRIVCSTSFSRTLGDAAINCIKHFCSKFEDLYDSEIEPIYNTHSVYHLIQDSIERNENPEDMNCFLFENYLGQLKKMIRTPNKPLSQVCKRLNEQKGTKMITIDYESTPSLIYKKCGKIIQAIKFSNMYFSINKKDSFVLLKSGKIMSISEILEDQMWGIKIRGSVFQFTENIFNISSLSSSAILMHRVKNPSNFQFSASIKDIITKCIVFPLSNSDCSGAIGLLHMNY